MKKLIWLSSLMILTSVNGKAQSSEEGKPVCGTSGSIEERVASCNTHEGRLSLVVRTESQKEVWLDSSTNLIWGDRFSEKVEFFDANKLCWEAHQSENGMLGLEFRVPSRDQYKEADKNGIRSVLPNMNFVFWTSSKTWITQFIPSLHMRIFDGSTGDMKTGLAYRSHSDSFRYHVDGAPTSRTSSESDEYSVRCVAKYEKP